MIEIVFTACTLIGSCSNERLTFMAQPGEISVFSCAKYGQGHLSKWAGEHPGHTIKRWRCQSARLEAKA